MVVDFIHESSNDSADLHGQQLAEFLQEVGGLPVMVWDAGADVVQVEALWFAKHEVMAAMAAEAGVDLAGELVAIGCFPQRYYLFLP